MKNLKDEIEGIENKWAEYDDVSNTTYFEHSHMLLDEDGRYIKVDALSEFNKELTSLIEQENERAVMGFIDYMYGQNLPLHKAGVVTVRAFAKQYLAERKGE